MDFNEQWETFLLKASKAFNVMANYEFLLFIIGIQELGQGYKAYSKQEKMDLINLALSKLMTLNGMMVETGRDNEGWPTFEVVGDKKELLPSELDKVLKISMMAYFEKELFVKDTEVINLN
jgi:hypothetical protein